MSNTQAWDGWKIVTLEVINWSFSLGGEHFTGRITGYKFRRWYTDGRGFESAEVTHRLTAKEAKALNKKDSARGFSLRKPGDISDRFETREQLEREASRQYRKHFPNARALAVGAAAVCNPQRMIAGAAEFVTAVNSLVEKQEKCGGYVRDPKKMTAILRQYDRLVRDLA